jgi:hypothetical protein
MRASIIPILLVLSGAAAAAPTLNPFAILPCDQRISALAAGIHLNIQGQWAEYNGTLAVEEAETKQAGNTTAFLLAKGALEAIIQSGQNLRLFNQQIVPPGNPAIPGLDKYAAAEEVEKNLAAGLTGDYAVDKAAIDSLKKDIKQGIQLNTDNLKNVSW